MAMNQVSGLLHGLECDNGLSSNGDFYGLNCEKGVFFDHECGKSNMGSDDMSDFLPQDPFSMDWLEDLENDFEVKALGFNKKDEIEECVLHDKSFSELNFVFSSTMRIHQDAGFNKINGNCDKCRISCDDRGGKNDLCDPSDGLFLALGYLGLGELLAVERVCKSLRDAVRGDPLLWRNIHVDCPFSNRVTDDVLMKLTDRAQGHLHSLSLVRCTKITDSGLKYVLERNPSLTKLSVPGCVRLTVDGILSSLKAFKSAGKVRLKYLGIYGVFGVTNQHFEEFKLLIGGDSSKLPSTCKPQFFGGGQFCVNSNEDRAMDIEACPKCQQLGLVYDCPSDSCKMKQSDTQLCRACIVCIMRCINCGCCLNNCEYEELFSFDLLCLDCWSQLLGCQERELKMTFLPKTTVLHKQASYHFYLYG